MAKELWKRSQAPKEDTWAVEDLYATEEAFLSDVTVLRLTVLLHSYLYGSPLCTL